MDFTFSCLPDLLTILQRKGFQFSASHILDQKSVFLRHDVEANFNNALRFAELESSLNIKGTFYFRIQEKHFRASIVEKIADLGHNIGYHYDDLSYCRGDYEKAIKRFENSLNTLREIADVKTINMEGAPRSKYDNRNLWSRYDYKDFGIEFEPYFDVDFKEVAYYTDTGRRWDGKFSVRDKAYTEEYKWGKKRDKSICLQFPKFKTTRDIISAIDKDIFPDKAMINFHPQRWHDKPFPWLKELIWQNVKNIGKGLMMKV